MNTTTMEVVMIAINDHNQKGSNNDGAR